MKFWSTSKSKLAVICDVGTASVSVGLAQFSDDDKPKILYTLRIPITIQEKPDIKDLPLVIERYLNEAFRMLSIDMHSKDEVRDIQNKKIDVIHVVFSSPWFVSKTQSIHIENSKPKPLQKSEVERCIETEEKIFEEECIHRTDLYFGKVDIAMIERELVKIKLNGYETSSPYLNDVKHSELTLYMSIVPHHILGEIRERAHSYFHTDNVTFNTFPLTLFHTVRKLFTLEEDYLLIDIAGENTDCTIVRDGILENSTTFAIGKNSLIRSIANKFSVTPEIALSYIEMLVIDSLEEHISSDVKEQINESISIWYTEFIKTLNNLVNKRRIPVKAFVTLDQSTARVYLDKLKSESSEIQFENILELSPELFGNSVNFGKFVFPDPFLCIDTLFIDTFKK